MEKLKTLTNKSPLVLPLGTAITVILFIIGSTWNITNVTNTIASRQDRLETGYGHIVEELKSHALSIEQLKQNEGIIKIQLGKLESILERVEAGQNKILGSLGR